MNYLKLVEAKKAAEQELVDFLDDPTNMEAWPGRYKDDNIGDFCIDVANNQRSGVITEIQGTRRHDSIAWKYLIDTGDGIETFVPTDQAGAADRLQTQILGRAEQERKNIEDIIRQRVVVDEPDTVNTPA